MRGLVLPAALVAISLLLAPLATAQEPESDEPTRDTVTLSGMARTLTLTGGLARPIVGLGVRVEDTDLSAETDAEGRFTLAEVPIGSATLVIDGPGYGRERLWVDVQAGGLYVQAMVDSDACPPGEMCLVAADAVVEISAEPAERAAEFVLELLLPDGTTRETALPGPFTLPWTGAVHLGDIELNVRLYEEHGTLTTMWRAELATLDGQVVSDGLVSHLEPGVMPGCSEHCSAQRDLIREVRFARSSVGDPTFLCEPQICP